MSSNKLRKCPKCGEKKLERLFGIGSGVIFKGSGFYETDYKRAGKAGTKKSSDGDAGSSETDAGTSDSKSDSKADSKSSEKSSSSSGSSSDGKSGGSSDGAGSGSKD
jgi:predicted nucleic acid-binding Zn ribbon protein